MGKVSPLLVPPKWTKDGEKTGPSLMWTKVTCIRTGTGMSTCRAQIGKPPGFCGSVEDIPFPKGSPFWVRVKLGTPKMGGFLVASLEIPQNRCTQEHPKAHKSTQKSTPQSTALELLLTWGQLEKASGPLTEDRRGAPFRRAFVRPKKVGWGSLSVNIRPGNRNRVFFCFFVGLVACSAPCWLMSFLVLLSSDPPSKLHF